MRFLQRRSFIALGVILLGCAAATRHPSPATTQSVAALRILKFESAVAIEHFREGDQDVDLRNIISFEGKQGDVYFGQADLSNPDGETTSTVPLVVATVKGAWNALRFDDPRLKNAEWQFVASGPADGEAWGVLDDSLNHKGKVILLAHSTDSAQTWTIGSVEKPFGSGDYDSFAMDKSGHGRLTVYVAPARKHPNRAGFYHFHTTDNGRTWSAADHESDALDPADDVPTDEDPPPLKSRPLQNARAMHPLSPAGRG